MCIVTELQDSSSLIVDNRYVVKGTIEKMHKNNKCSEQLSQPTFFRRASRVTTKPLYAECHHTDHSCSLLALILVQLPNQLLHVTTMSLPCLHIEQALCEIRLQVKKASESGRRKLYFKKDLSLF
jgi:hypothetical protein